MSGLLAKLKNMISPSQAEQAADAIEKNVTDEKVDQVVSKVPGGDQIAAKIPDNVGEKAADLTRDTFGDNKPAEPTS